MNVVLSTSPHLRHAAVLQADFEPDARVMYSFAPVGLLSLIAMARRECPAHRCSLYDLNRRIIAGALPTTAAFYAAAATDICAGQPDVVGFMTECDSYHHVLGIADEIKRIAPGCIVMLGGPHASAVAESTLSKCDAIDAVVIGEGEHTFAALLDAIAAGNDGPVAGALRRDRRGNIMDGPTRPLIDSLDELPVPAFDLYTPAPGEEMFVEVGRGCPFQCQFCSTAPFWRRRHRVKSPNRILREMHLLRDMFGTTRVHLTHDLLTTNRAWVEDLCGTLEAAGVPMRWTCSARTDTVDEDLLATMARAGCDAIYFGVESGSARILREIHKSIPVEQSFAVLDSCKRLGITPNVGFIVGFPSEDEASLRETLDAYQRALEIGCRPVHLFGYCPFAQSAMYPELRSLECTGHFVDLPLGETTDARNRLRVASDRDLFGAYFRPRLPDLVPGVDDAVYALDEFSPLVEAVLVPALTLSHALGGIYYVLRDWLRWIQAHNDRRGAAAYRRGYGSPAAFAAFVQEALLALPGCPEWAADVARATCMNLRVVEESRPGRATSMASHRSLALPRIDSTAELTLQSRLTLGSVLAALALDHDVQPALLGQVGADIPRRRTYLVWQLTPERDVRLLETDPFLFEVLSALKTQPATVGDLLLGRLRPSAEREESDASDVAPHVMLDALSSAAREGLVVAGGAQ